MVMNIDDIKIMTLKALMADDLLMSGLVLKGSNVLIFSNTYLKRKKYLSIL